MITTANIVLFGWPILCLVFFSMLPARRAVLVSLLGALLFLPVADVHLPGLFVNRWSAASVGAFLGVLMFDSRKLLTLRFSWIDLPIIIICLCSIPTSVLNGLGWYEGVLLAVDRFLTFGLSYLMGKLYFHNPKGLRELAVGLFIGGLVYTPFCLVEIRMSPQFHTWVYGYHQHDFGQSFRYGGWRPVVFMNHGLEVGMWMTAASLSGVWLWLTGSLQKVLSIPVKWLLAPLLITTFLCKSSGSLVLLAVGLGALAMTRWGRTKFFILGLVAVPLCYIALRAPGLWSGQEIVEIARLASEDRAASLNYRLTAENDLARHAMRQPVFGWGGWGRNRPSTFDSEVVNMATDGFWIITLGSYGFVGLAGLLGLILLPPAILAFRLKTALWSHPWCAPAAILAVLLLLFMMDCLMNALMNSFFLVASGGLSRAVVAQVRHRATRTAGSPAAGAPLRA